ncbi:MAG: UDP-N-acetylglucosamine--N-acetylmuramyl-(pentapeptide) pyrophosphoryl-undecaprenol N-acetylglucosamine transferase [Phycisphaerae bacterium]
MHDAIYIFAGGGTGGHLYPGLAVAEELQRLHRNARVVMACSNRAIDRRILDMTPHAIVPQPVLPVPRSSRGWGKFLHAWRASRRLARDLLGDLQPRAVLGLGGFAAGPIVKQAARVGIPTALINHDAVPGLANRFLAGRVEAIFTQFDATADRFAARHHGKIRCVGCPVRHGFGMADRDEAMTHFALDPDRRTLLVFGGSLLAESIVRATIELAGSLESSADRWQVLALTRDELADPLRGAMEAVGVPCVTQPYCERMDLAYEAADLAITRCGAGTAAELAITATPAVIFPYPHHRDQHQKLNAAELESAGAAIVLDDAVEPAVNAAALREHLLPVLENANHLGEMKLAAERCAKPHAARAIAEWLIEQH